MASRSIVIIGGGIIGCSTAFYLSQHSKANPNTQIHIVEACHVAAGASGKAGGFMALNWHRGPTASLAKLSFDLHQQLSDEYGGEKKWGYRRVTTLQVQADSSRRRTQSSGLDWLDNVDSSEVIGTPDDTAQVTPNLFTEAICSLAQEKGVKLTIATVDGIEMDETGNPCGVLATNDVGERVTIPATDVVFAAGPWTAGLAKSTLRNRASAALDIEPSPCSTSVIFRPDIETSPHALFTEVTISKDTGSPEVYPRPDGTIYMCGDHSDPGRQRPLTKKATDATPSDVAIRNHQRRLEFLSEKLKNAKVEITQACFRPESKRGRPIIGKLGPGLWIASGHSVWGICNGPGTGKVMAELILDGKATSANIQSLKP